MRVIAAIYAFLCAVAIALCLVRPYGSPEFAVLGYWPGFSAALAATVLFPAYKLNIPAKIFFVFVASFFLSAATTSIISSRNNLLVAEADGLVIHRYIGEHALKAIEIRGSDGEFHRIEGIPEMLWNLIQPGQSAIKNRGSFDLVVGGRRTTLDQWAHVWKTKSQLNSEQIADGKTPETPQSPR